MRCRTFAENSVSEVSYDAVEKLYGFLRLSRSSTIAVSRIVSFRDAQASFKGFLKFTRFREEIARLFEHAAQLAYALLNVDAPICTRRRLKSL